MPVKKKDKSVCWCGGLKPSVPPPCNGLIPAAQDSAAGGEGGLT